MTSIIQYLAGLKREKIVLWCYLIWYLVSVSHHFDPAPKIWLNALGISAVIGTALMLSVASANKQTDRWQIFRLYLMPFCVSSFSALIKDQGFITVFSPDWAEIFSAIFFCAMFVVTVALLKTYANKNEAKLHSDDTCT